jgi:RNA polymerase sigma-70 factor, ECF subfamily
VESPVDARVDPDNRYLTEVACIEAARDGDQGACERLYRDHAGRIHGLCLRLLGDGGLAEELTQECFLKAWRELAGFRFDAAFSTWLHRVAVNTVVSYQRRHGPWLRWLKQEPEGVPESASGGAATAERIDLEAAIARLPERARQVFVLVDVEGYSHEQAAEALGVAVGTSKAQLFRARQLLREMLS